MKVIKNYLYNMTYQIFVLLVPLITIPYISRVLGPSGVGVNTITTSTAQYFVLLANLGLATYGQREVAYKRESKNNLSQSFWEIEIVSLVTAVGSLILFFIFVSLIDKYRVFYLAQAFLIIASAADISWLFMGLEKFKITVFRNFVVKLMSIVLIFTLVRSHDDLLIYILIISITTLLGNLSLWPYLKRYVHKVNFKSMKFKQHLLPALTLFIPQVAINVYTVLNKIMLGQFSTIESAGFFDSSDKIIRLLLTLITAFTTVMMPHVANAYMQGKTKSVERMLNKGLIFATTICFPMVALINAVASEFVPWFFGKQFVEVINVMHFESFAMIPIAISGIIGAQYLVPLNLNKQYTFSIFGGAIINIIINIPLIYYFQASGAAIATIFAEICVAGIQLLYVRKKIYWKSIIESLAKIFISSIVIYILVSVESMILHPSFVSFAIEGVSGLILYLGSLYVLRFDELIHFKNTFKDV